MTYQRLPYDDAAPTSEMATDCAEVGRALHLSAEHVDVPPATPRERTGLDEIVVPDSLAELAQEMHLHFG